MTKEENRATILIVDDQPTNIQALAKLLKEEYRIQVANSGEKALGLLGEGTLPDLILLDVQMPQMDGHEVCKRLKSNPATQEIPVIFVTANSSQEDEEYGFSIGAVDYITKPFHPTIVKARVGTHIALQLKNQKLNELNREMARYVELVDQNVIISSTDPAGNITRASQAFCEISGYTKEELIGQNHRIVRHPDMPGSLYEELWQTISADKRWRGEMKNLKKDGGFYWVDVTITPIFDDEHTKVGYTAIRQDITDKKRIEEISITDGLTGLFNRRHFNETFPRVIDTFKRKDELVCFLLMDIDHFKQYNDHYGHQAGDDVLIRFSKCVRETLKRADDRAFRLGGEEFGVVYRAETKEKAIEFAQMMCRRIEELHIPHDYSSASSYVTASMGLLCKRATRIKDMDEAYKETDDLLYESKENGRNRVTVSEGDATG